MYIPIMITKTRSILRGITKDERGVTAIEYAIIGVAISAIVLAVFAKDGQLGEALKAAMTSIATNINSANAVKP
jgi:pilus assembly protein Flp/PilA